MNKLQAEMMDRREVKQVETPPMFFILLAPLFILGCIPALIITTINRLLK